VKKNPPLPPDDLPFHYRREERVERLPEEVRERIYGTRKRFFIEKRHLIVIIDILLVLAAFGGVTAYRNSLARDSRFAGCRIELMGVVYGEKVLSSLKMTVIDPPEPGTLMEAEFGFEGSGITAAAADLIPSGEGETRLLRAELPLPEELTPLTVRVRSGDEEVLLKKVLRPE